MHYKEEKGEPRQLTLTKQVVSWTSGIAAEMDREVGGVRLWFKGRVYSIFNILNMWVKRKQEISGA